MRTRWRRLLDIDDAEHLRGVAELVHLDRAHINSSLSKAARCGGPRSSTRGPAGFELRAGGLHIVLHGDGLDSPDLIDEVVHPCEHAVAEVLGHGADVLYKMRRGAGGG